MGTFPYYPPAGVTFGYSPLPAPNTALTWRPQSAGVRCRNDAARHPTTEQERIMNKLIKQTLGALALGVIAAGAQAG